MHVGFQMNRTHYFGSVCGCTMFVTFLPKWTEKMIVIGNVFEKVNPPPKERLLNTMITDPKEQAEEVKQPEDAVADQATEESAEEGTIEG